MSAVVVCGPMACGKTHHRDAIASLFRCAYIVDDAEECVLARPLRRQTLYLTNLDRRTVRDIVRGRAKVVVFADLRIRRPDGPRNGEPIS